VSALATALRKMRLRWLLVLFSIRSNIGIADFVDTDILDDSHLNLVTRHTCHGDVHLALALVGFILAPLKSDSDCSGFVARRRTVDRRPSYSAVGSCPSSRPSCHETLGQSPPEQAHFPGDYPDLD
jgi:hypothetical protein